MFIEFYTGKNLRVPLKEYFGSNILLKVQNTYLWLGTIKPNRLIRFMKHVPDFKTKSFLVLHFATWKVGTVWINPNRVR